MHGVAIESATLPEGWIERTIAVSHAVNTSGNTGLCIEAHDLAASKLVAFREKDRLFVATLLSEALIDRGTLLDRILALEIDDDVKRRLLTWVRVTIDEIAEGN